MTAEMPNKTYPVTGRPMADIQKSLHAMIDAAAGAHLPDRKKIDLFIGGDLVAKIEIIDDALWSEMAKDLGIVR